MTDIGLKDCGFNEELEILHETNRAYLLMTEDNQELWLPKSFFDDETGELLDMYLNLYEEKLEEGE